MKLSYTLPLVVGILGLVFGLAVFSSSEAFAGDDFLLKSNSAKLCLDGHARGKDVKVSRCRTPFGAQRWDIDPESGQIKHTRRNLCLAVSNFNRANGARVVLWPCNGGTNQRWILASNGSIRSALNGKCLDVSKVNQSAKRANVHMWDCHLRKNQQWEKVRVPSNVKKKKRGKMFVPKK